MIIRIKVHLFQNILIVGVPVEIMVLIFMEIQPAGMERAVFDPEPFAKFDDPVQTIIVLYAL